jgi:ADP-ribose pyrophosphatase YjhB (NUDIX family)
MITFETPQGQFNYRVAGVAIVDGHVLLHQAQGEDFWTLPGGRLEAMETASDALRREMLEEAASAGRVSRHRGLSRHRGHHRIDVQVVSTRPASHGANRTGLPS